MYHEPDFGRLRKVLLLEGEPDRVPMLEGAVEKEIKSAFLSKPVDDLATEVEFWANAGYDYVPLQAGVRTLFQPRPGEDQAGALRQSLAGGRRATARYSLYSQTASEREWAEEGHGIITTLADFEAFPWPEPEDFDFSTFDRVKQYLPMRMKVIAIIGYIFLPAWRVMGFTNFCASLTDNPEVVRRLLDKFGSLEYGVVQRLVDFDSVGAIWTAEDIAYSEGLLVAPEYLRSYLFPWYRRIGDLCRAKGLPLIHHSDGRLYQVLDDLIDCGVRALNPIEPKAMDIVYLKRKYGNRLCLCGNIDLGYTLTLGTPQEVDAEVKQRIREVAPGGGYCLGSSNSVTEYVPLANYNAMREATFRYGRYPIAV